MRIADVLAIQTRQRPARPDALFDGRLAEFDLPDLDFVRIAEAFGVSGIRARDPAALRAALECALASGAPHLIESPVCAQQGGKSLVVHRAQAGALMTDKRQERNR